MLVAFFLVYSVVGVARSTISLQFSATVVYCDQRGPSTAQKTGVIDSISAVFVENTYCYFFSTRMLQELGDK